MAVFYATFLHCEGWISQRQLKLMKWIFLNFLQSSIDRSTLGYESYMIILQQAFPFNL